MTRYLVITYFKNSQLLEHAFLFYIFEYTCTNANSSKSFKAYIFCYKKIRLKIYTYISEKT